MCPLAGCSSSGLCRDQRERIAPGRHIAYAMNRRAAEATVSSAAIAMNILPVGEVCSQAELPSLRARTDGVDAAGESAAAIIIRDLAGALSFSARSTSLS